jgi:hypothetical protein
MIVRESDTTHAQTREARGQSTIPLPLLLTVLCWEIGCVGMRGGAVAAPSLGVADYPYARRSAAEDDREAAALRRRLRVVEKLLTGQPL